jgi:hypothetical protein
MRQQIVSFHVCAYTTSKMLFKLICFLSAFLFVESLSNDSHSDHPDPKQERVGSLCPPPVFGTIYLQCFINIRRRIERDLWPNQLLWQTREITFATLNMEEMAQIINNCKKEIGILKHFYSRHTHSWRT